MRNFLFVKIGYFFYNYLVISQLESFYELTLRDPLFAAEGMNLESAEKAIGELERATELQEKFYWEHAKRLRWFIFLHPFVKSLRPIPFLKKFLAAEKIRRAFLASPTPDQAGALLASWKNAAKFFRKSAKRNLAALRLIGKIEGLQKTGIDYQFHKYAVTFEKILENIEDIIVNAEALNQEILRRERILAGSVKMDSGFAAPIYPIPYTLNGPPLEKDFLDILELENRITGNSGQEYGPIFYTLDAFDGIPTNHQFFVYISSLPKYGAGCNILKITLADERYFLEIDPAKYKFHQSIAQYKPLVRRNIPFFHYHPTAPYAVRDLMYWADLATVVDLEWRSPNLNAELVKSQKSSCFDMLLWYSALDCLTSLRSIKAGLNDGSLSPLSYLYIARSFPSLYYLTFNRSIWRVPRRPDFSGGRFTNKAAVHKTYNEIKHLLTPDLLQKIFEGYRYRAEDWKKEGIWEE